MCSCISEEGLGAAGIAMTTKYKRLKRTKICLSAQVLRVRKVIVNSVLWVHGPHSGTRAAVVVIWNVRVEVTQGKRSNGLHTEVQLRNDMSFSLKFN